MTDVVVVGDVMIDVGVDAEDLKRGGDVHGKVRLRPGGAGANAAVWAAWHGARVLLYGRVGDDLPGRMLRESITERGVDARLSVDPDAPTGTMLVVRERGERSMVADRGANSRLSPADLPGRLEADAVLVSGYLVLDPSAEPAARAALDRARAAHVAVDAASWPLIEAYGGARFLEAVRPSNLLLANDAEARALTGLEGQAGAMALAAACGRACVKLGARGALLAEGDGLTHEQAPEVREADPTGAGDAFDGVLVAALAAGATPGDALREACLAGARQAGSPGAWP